MHIIYYDSMLLYIHYHNIVAFFNVKNVYIINITFIFKYELSSDFQLAVGITECVMATKELKNTQVKSE